MRIALTGDTIVMRPILHTPDAATRELAALLRASDVVFTNLEVLPNDFRGDPSFENDGSHLAAPAAILDDLKAHNVNLIATCNNHSLDYGISGLLVTLAELDKRGLAHAGCGTTLENARMPVYLERPQGTLAMLASSKPDLLIRCPSALWAAVVQRKIAGVQLMTHPDLHLEGDLGLFKRLPRLFPPPAD